MGSAACGAGCGAAWCASRGRRRPGCSSQGLLLVATVVLVAAVVLVATVAGVGLAGECEEDVVEVGGVYGQLLDLHRRTVETFEQGAQRPDGALAGHLQGERVLVARAGVEQAGRVPEPGEIGESQHD